MEMVLMRRRAQRPRGHSPGFNLIEVLIASVLFLAVALGVLPLFQRAIRTNTAGQNSTDVANLARSQLERYMQIDYRSPLLTVNAGETQNQIQEHYLRDTDVWEDHLGDHGIDPANPAIWERVTTVRYYNVGAVRESSGAGATADPLDDIETGIIDSSEALDGSATPLDVHFKEIEVQVTGTLAGGGIIGPSKRIVVRGLRSQ